MTPAEASPSARGFQRQGTVLRLDKQLLAGMETAWWRLPVIVRLTKYKALALEAAHRRDPLRGRVILFVWIDLAILDFYKPLRLTN